ncbi:MAG TPA: hypothetical protein VHB50_14015 [Bryobacteraceae bacterium]|nr:hypothetical protein [Bryobacteraceae bacterium]
MLFEMSEPRIQHLPGADEFTSKEIALLIKTLIHPSFEIIETLIMDQKTDKDCQSRQSGADGRNDHLGERTHSWPLVARFGHRMLTRQ